MNRALAVLVFFFLESPALISQSATVRSWIFFSDKPSLSSSSSTEALAAEYGISPRALRRRAKVLPAHGLIDSYDQPVSAAYIRQIESLGMRVHSVSRWLNAVSVTANSEQLTRVAEEPFVRSIQRVADLTHPPVSLQPAIPSFSLPKTSLSGLNYGPSYTQLANIRVTPVHDLGIDGSGVLVGMIDDGFNNHRAHSALRNITILDEYDFIHDLPTTQRQPWEGFSQGNHGAATLSALAGFAEGILIGPAYGASLILAKTEMDSTEVSAEEDLYVEALEWLEQSGADIISTSLGYDDFIPVGTYNPGDVLYSMKDGRTATTSIGAIIAARKGVLLVTSMGNEGWWRKEPDSTKGNSYSVIPGVTGSLITPADADSILAVGATHSDLWIASFSSTGPTADGRTKPEIVAQGVGVIAADGAGSGGFVSANGTSFSAPLVAGAAALLLSSKPELTPMQVREAILATAYEFPDPDDPSKTATYPNNYYGWGVLDAYKALLYHGIAFSSKPKVILSDSVSVYISIASDTTLVADSLTMIYQLVNSGPFLQIPLQSTPVANLFHATIPTSTDPGWPRGYFTASDRANRNRLAPFNAPESLFVFADYAVTHVPGITSREFHLLPNYPNPFNAGTTISFDAPGGHEVELFIFDILGRRIKTLYRGITLAERRVFYWDGTDEGGRSVSTGVYVSMLRSGSTIRSQKILLLR